MTVETPVLRTECATCAFYLKQDSFLPSLEKQMQTWGRVPGFWRECCEGKAKVGTFLLFLFFFSPSMPLFSILLQSQHFAGAPDFFLPRLLCWMSLDDRRFCHAYGESFLNLKDSPCVMISHLCFFVFVCGVLDVCSKINIFDDDFLCFLFLSDFCVFGGGFAC